MTITFCEGDLVLIIVNLTIPLVMRILNPYGKWRMLLVIPNGDILNNARKRIYLNKFYP